MSDKSLTDELLDALADREDSNDLESLRRQLQRALEDREAAVRECQAAVQERQATLERLAEREKSLDELQLERDALLRTTAKLQHQLSVLRRNTFGRKSEKVLPGQLALSFEDPNVELSVAVTPEESEEDSGGDEPETEKPKNRSGNRRGMANRPHGRQAIPDTIPCVNLELPDPPAVLAAPDDYVCIGQETSEHLDRHPASLIRVVTLRNKWATKKTTATEPSVIATELPTKPIDQGLLGPGLAAELIVAKYAEHMPLHRLEGRFEREGLRIARSTLCGWTTKLGKLVKPLPEAMCKEALSAPWVMTDATGTLVQDKDQCRRTHFWVLVAPDKHVLFRYTQKHDKAATQSLLGGYTGVIVADANSVFDHLYGESKATESGCWSHARRKFFDALESDKPRASLALQMINALFAIERNLDKKGATSRQRKTLRAKKSKPIVDSLMAWCTSERPNLDEASPLQKAIGYLLNQELALRHFLSDPRVPIHNNRSERELRRLVVGRKNWLFHGSDEGAEHTAYFVSLLASCQMHGIQPWAYLRDLFTLLPDWPKHRVIELAPAYWRTTSQRSDVRALLDANLFRMVTALHLPELGEDAHSSPSQP